MKSLISFVTALILTASPLFAQTQKQSVQVYTNRLINGITFEDRIAAIVGLISKKQLAAPAIPALLDAAKEDVAPVVREWSVICLGTIGPDAKAALPDLIKLAEFDKVGEESNEDPFTDLRMWAKTAIVAIDPDSKEIRKYILESLKENQITDDRTYKIKLSSRLSWSLSALNPSISFAAFTGTSRFSRLPYIDQDFGGIVYPNKKRAVSYLKDPKWATPGLIKILPLTEKNGEIWVEVAKTLVKVGWEDKNCDDLFKSYKNETRTVGGYLIESPVIFSDSCLREMKKKRAENVTK